jgi:acyl-lipid Delta6-acetylenase / acyl-lipid (9-3)-desaturase
LVDVFNAFHPAGTEERLAEFYVGDLVREEWQAVCKLADEDGFAREIDELRHRMTESGLFESNKFYYLFKVLFNYSILALSIQCIRSIPAIETSWLNQWVLLIVGSVLLGVFWQQSGWLSHDFLHHQVFSDRRWNNIMGLLLGNVGQGFSVSWWKNKHNTHHASPNVHGTDPDIDTMPILAWSEHALKQDNGDSWLSRFLVYNQAQLYFVILTFARLAWAQQSFVYALTKCPDNALVEFGTIAVHWMSYLALMITCLTPVQSLAFFVLSQASCGFLLAVVFSLNHNGMPVLSAQESLDTEFYRKQIITGRDIHPTIMATWLTGGLNYQIEHHLFPSLPRHNFHLVQPHVRALCKKYNVPYHVTDMVSGTKEVLGRLDSISILARMMH